VHTITYTHLWELLSYILMSKRLWVPLVAAGQSVAPPWLPLVVIFSHGYGCHFAIP
jgi:hypothetical protein